MYRQRSFFEEAQEYPNPMFCGIISKLTVLSKVERSLIIVSA
jgi:hypothetical protein